MSAQLHSCTNNPPNLAGKPISIGGAGVSFETQGFGEDVWPYVEFGDPLDSGYTPDKIRAWSQPQHRPRASEA